MESIYKKLILDHTLHPRNKGSLEAMTYVKRGRNPRCGDDIEIGVSIDEQSQLNVRFLGRGCSICMASASMMSESLQGLSVNESKQLLDDFSQWFVQGSTDSISNETLTALDSVRQHSARKKCVMLAWDAMNEIVEEMSIQYDTAQRD